jgi:hypothetical protein
MLVEIYRSGNLEKGPAQPQARQTAFVSLPDLQLTQRRKGAKKSIEEGHKPATFLTLRLCAFA